MSKAKKRADGYYTRSFSFNGKRYYCYAETQAELEKKVAEKRSKLERGLTTAKDITLETYYDLWRSGRKGTITASSEYSTDIDFVDIRREIGGMKLQKISRATVKSLQQTLSKKLSSRGVNKRITLLSGIMQGAVLDNLVLVNPCDGVKQLKRTEPKVEDSTHRHLTEEEVNLFLEATKDSIFQNVYIIALQTGMRAGEILALTWADVDFKTGFITVNKTVERVRSGYIVGDTPKTDAGFRTIPMTDKCRQAFVNQRKVNDFLSGGKVTRMDGRIFTNRKGGLYGASEVDQYIYRALEKIRKNQDISIDRFSSHSFRATFATNCADHGMRPEVLSKILGHSNVAFTLNKYYRLSDDIKVEEVRKIADAI